MNKENKLTKMGLGMLVTSFVLMIIILFLKLPANKTLAAEIEENFTNISKLIDEQVRNKSEVSFSSNPYDYIKDNKYYENIVNKGFAALPILEKKLQNSETYGLQDYIVAIAIEEITKTNLKNDPNTAWSTAKEFNVEWDEFIDGASKDIEAIFSSTSSIEIKIKDIEKYGLLAVPYLSKYSNQSTNKNESANNDIQVINAYLKKLSVTTEEISKIENYLNDKIQ